MALFNELMTLASFVLVLFMTVWTVRRTTNIMNKIPSLDDLIKQDEEGEWTVEERLGRLLQVVGSTMFQSAKMSALQGLSVQRKLDKGLKGAFAKDIIDQKLPILSLLGDFLGYNVKSYVAKNPDALFQLMQQPAIQQLLGQFIKMNPQPQGSPSNYGWNPHG